MDAENCWWRKKCTCGCVFFCFISLFSSFQTANEAFLIGFRGRRLSMVEIALL
jgi:hypothetical protein